MTLASTHILRWVDKNLHSDMWNKKNVAALTQWGIHFSDDCITNAAESLNGADGDDGLVVTILDAAENIKWGDISYPAGTRLALILRSPMSMRVHEGRVAVEYWLCELSDDETTLDYIKRALKGQSPMKLEQKMLPPRVIDMPTPQHTDAKLGELEFFEQVAGVIENSGSFESILNQSSSVMYLASLNGWKLASNRSMDATGEFIIDVSTKGFDIEDMMVLSEVGTEIGGMIGDQIQKDGTYSPRWRHRSGLRGKDFNALSIEEGLFDDIWNDYQTVMEDAVEVLESTGSRYIRALMSNVTQDVNLRKPTKAISKVTAESLLLKKRVEGRLTAENENPNWQSIYEATGAELAEILSDGDIYEMLLQQGQKAAWSSHTNTNDAGAWLRKVNQTNEVSGILLSGALFERTIMITKEQKVLQELFASGLYNTLVSGLFPADPFDRTMVYRFARLLPKEETRGKNCLDLMEMVTDAFVNADSVLHLMTQVNHDLDEVEEDEEGEEGEEFDASVFS